MANANDSKTSVLVVGGGIAGIQASLDLADEKGAYGFFAGSGSA